MKTRKTKVIQFRCSAYEKKLMKIKAVRSGISLSDYCRRCCVEKQIRERLSEDHIEVYKTLVRYHNNFKRIGNMFRKKDPRLSVQVNELANEIKSHLNRIRK